MKRILVVLPCLFLFLCGCNQTESKQESESPVAVEENRTIIYNNIPEFLDSEFCVKMQSAGFVTYLPSYDPEKYELVRIASDANFHRLSLKEKSTGDIVAYSITYDAHFKNVGEIAEIHTDETEKNVLTSVEKDGTVYEVYISRVPFMEKDCYNLEYLPYEGYRVYICSDSPTPEQALTYIHDFTPVPASEWNIE